MTTEKGIIEKQDPQRDPQSLLKYNIYITVLEKGKIKDSSFPGRLLAVNILFHCLATASHRMKNYTNFKTLNQLNGAGGLVKTRNCIIHNILLVSCVTLLLLSI